MLQYYDIDLEKEEVLEDFKYPLRWQDTWGYRLGGTVHANDHWWVHAGWNYEDAANPEYIGGTETDRHTLGFGLTARYFGLDIDFGYAHIWQKDVETPAPEDTMGNALDDGRGRYKSGYDVFATALNINLERMYYAYNGKELWKKKRK
jgi:long-subunit fatty acid transport protein